MRSTKTVSRIHRLAVAIFFMNRVDNVAGIVDSRLRTRDKQTAFQRSLETLKRTLPRHSGVLLHRLTYGTGHRSGLSVDSPKSSEGEDDDEDEDEEPLPEPSRVKWDFFKPFAGARRSKGIEPDEEVEDEDKDEDGGKGEEEGGEGENDWIVEDDGLEGVPELPMAFNMSSHQDLSHHFKIICHLFVHLAVLSPSRRASFIQDIKAGEHLNITPKSPFHMIYDVYCPVGFRVFQLKTSTSTLLCQRSDER